MSRLKKPSYFLSVWVTDGCNKRCAYCFYGISDLFASGFKPSYMNEKTADATIEFINSGHVEAMSFFGGEPLLNWNIIKRILNKSRLPLITKGAGIKRRPYNITTNGTLFTEEIIEELARFNVHINLSLDGTKETQDRWRDNSYDAIMKFKDVLLEYPSLQVLKALADPSKLYEDVKHIKELGFKQLFINLMDPFGRTTYKKFNVKDFKRQYKQAIIDFNGKDFSINDYKTWKRLIKKDKQRIGCGYSNRGLCVDPLGDLYPCHQAPSMGKDFKIGDIWNGIDPVKEKQVRNVPNAPQCSKCKYKLTKCYVNMWNKHHRFGVDPPRWASRFGLAKIEVIEELEHLKTKGAYCSLTSLVKRIMHTIRGH